MGFHPASWFNSPTGLRLAGLGALFIPIPGVNLAVSYWFNRQADKLARYGALEAQAAGASLNIMSNEASVPVIYGQARVGLVLADVQQDSAQVKTIAVVGALCLGSNGGAGIDSVQKVYFDDVLAIDAPTATAAATNYTGVQAPWSDGGAGTVYGTDLWCVYGLHLGADAQTNDTQLDTRFTNWSTTDDARGICYLALLMYYNEAVWTTGRPNVTALVKGQKVYDTRDASTAWSDNPALIIRDFLTSVKYGMGIPTAQVNAASITAAANYCDVLVDIPGGGTQKRYTCNGILDPADGPQTNLARLLSSCRGEIVRIGSEYHLKIRQVTTAETFELTTQNIVGDFEFFRGGIQEAPNRITATFIDPANSYQANDVSFPAAGDANAYLTEDNSYSSQAFIELPFTNDLYRAAQTAQVLLMEGRADIGCALTANREALKLAYGDVVKVTHPTPAWTAKQFFVLAIGILPDGNVRLVLREYESTAYTLEALDAAVTPPNTNLPSSTTCAAPTSLVLTSDGTTAATLQDATVVPRIKVAWTASTDAFLAGYEIRRKVTAEADSTYQIVASPSVSDVQAFVADVVNGVEYSIGVRAVNAIGIRSSWLSDTVTVATTEGVATATVTAYLDGTAFKIRRVGGTAASMSYFAKATEPSLAEVQGGTDTTDATVTAYTFSASGTEWVGVLLYTDAASSVNESGLLTFPLTYQVQTAGVLGEVSGGTSESTYAKGDTLYASAADTLSKLTVGAAHAVLQVATDVPSWQTSLTGLTGHAVYDNGTKSGAWDLDAANGNIQRATINSTHTITLTNFVEGSPIMCILEYAGTYTPTITSADYGDSVPTFSANVAKADWVHIVKIGSVYFASVSTGHANPT
uniref:Putative tail protein n=1 Tax=viral metagenome TaxID=1070528 RepID=A0A6M3K5F3_9ZZZZ